jgi:GT2 family glycosyltransferase
MTPSDRSAAKPLPTALTPAVEPSPSSGPDGAAPRVVIVILNWNGRDDVLECLASTRRLHYRNFEIVVVDNGSSDDSVSAISSQFPDITLVQTGANLGYAGGNNVGIRWALDHSAAYVLVLNNDTTVSADLLHAFVGAARTLPAGSVLGAKIFFHVKPDTLWFAGGMWNGRTNKLMHIGYGRQDGAAFNCPDEVDYVTGCALFASADTFKDVGLFDERFFLTFEETDWCYRARARGHKCIVVPDARLWHKVSSSFGGADSPLIDYFMVRNQLLWAKNHLPRSARRGLHRENVHLLRRIFLPPFAFADAASFPLKSLFWSLTTWVKTIRRNIGSPNNRASLMGLRDYYLGRFGNCPDEVRELARPFRREPKLSKQE